MIGGIIARYQEAFRIELYAVMVLGNHLHFLVRAPDRNVDQFCANVNREIAKRINKLTGRQGPLWARRYDDVPVPTEEDLREAFLYVATNPTHHGLMRDSLAWPGLSSTDQLLRNEDQTFPFRHFVRGKLVTSYHTLRILPLPEFENLSPGKRKVVILDLIKGRTDEIASERKAQKKGFLGLVGLRRIPIGARPRTSAESPRPVCFSKDRIIRQQFRLAERERRRRYSLASFRYRSGERDVSFPEDTFPPPLLHSPRPAPPRVRIKFYHPDSLNSSPPYPLPALGDEGDSDLASSNAATAQTREGVT